ncbi:MAG TPA: UDP-glucose 4-epimerase GalE [Capsulimonadaceae bacterium]|jgi:UDP-glucose 4-epimerase
MSNVLVTGGAGYIGSHTTKLLLRDGHNVVIFDSLELGHREVLQYLPGAKLVVGNIGDDALVRETLAKHEIDAVVHFAAYASVPESVANPEKYYTNNIYKSLTLLNAVKDAGIKKLIFSSSAATFGEPQYTPIDEDHPQKPTNPYGQTKLDFEYILKWYDVAYGIKSVWLRYFCAAGADPEGELGEDHTPETHMIPLSILAALGRRDNIKMFGQDYPTEDGTGVRDYIHVTDLGSAHVLALKALNSGAQTSYYNLGNGKGYSVKQVIETTRQVTGLPINAIEAPRRAGDPAILVASAGKITAELGWQPQYGDLPTMIRTAFEWFRAHPNGYGVK